jgi:uroporphyrinogen decarboxylase
MIELAHSLGMEVWMHSCGNITESIPHWIDIKLDVLSNLQALALDLPAIAEAYRGQICFMGGLDVQENLVNGTPETVRAEVKAVFDDFHASEGKYIASPCNTIMPETPVENVWALFEAFDKFGRF